MAMTREQATAAVAVATEQRDGIQANLLDLDGSFGKRLLAGASLAGQTKQRWEAATADLASMWEIFTAYSAVVDRAAELLARIRRSSGPELAEVTTLLTGISVRLTRAPAPLARRDLTDSGRSELTLATAVREMNRTFARVAEVVTTAETVWNEVADRLDRISADLGQAGQRAAGLADDESAGALASASAELGRLRDVLNSDPLALWQRGQVDTARLERLREQTAVAVSRVGEETVGGTLDRALRIATPEIFNTDKGVQFTSAAFLDKLSGQGVRISMDGKGRFLDNIFIERLWRSLKYEEVVCCERVASV